MAFDVNSKRNGKPFLLHSKSLFCSMNFIICFELFFALISEKKNKKAKTILGHDHQFLCNAVEIQ